jgi:hypothetical protein
MVRVEGAGRHGYMVSGWPGQAFRSEWGRVLGWGRSGPWFGSSLDSIVNTPRCNINYIYIHTEMKIRGGMNAKIFSNKIEEC